MEAEFTLVRRIEIARKMTARAASVKDWRLNRKADREAKAEAVRLTKEGRGYVIATPREIRAMYPFLFQFEDGPDRDKKMVWAFCPSYPYGDGRCRIFLCVI